MPKCPNCGLETARTEDWACQWCGYPLISGSYKKLPMTFRQLQAEKSPAPEPPVRVEPVPEPTPEPKAVTEAKSKPVIPPEPEPMPVPEPEVIPEPEITAEPKAKTEPVAESGPAPEPKPTPEPETELEPEPKPIPVPEPEVIPEPEPVPVPEPEVIPEPEVMTEPEAETEPIPESGPAPEPAPALEPHPDSGIIETSVAQLNAAYRQDKAGTNARLKDSVLLVTGVVDKIVLREHLGIQYLLLSSGSNQERFNVRCTFDSQQGAALRRLTEGESVTVKGSYGGYQRNIMLKDCAMVG